LTEVVGGGGGNNRKEEKQPESTEWFANIWQLTIAQQGFQVSFSNALGSFQFDSETSFIFLLLTLSTKTNRLVLVSVELFYLITMSISSAGSTMFHPPRRSLLFFVIVGFSCCVIFFMNQLLYV
jgi:hypothetical protein